jgi:hypothetical protein
VVEATSRTIATACLCHSLAPSQLVLLEILREPDLSLVSLSYLGYGQIRLLGQISMAVHQYHLPHVGLGGKLAHLLRRAVKGVWCLDATFVEQKVCTPYQGDQLRARTAVC